MIQTSNHLFSDHLTISRIRLAPISSQSNRVLADFRTEAFSLALIIENRAFALLEIAMIQPSVVNLKELFKLIWIPPDGAKVQAVEPPELVNPTEPTALPDPFTNITLEVSSASLFPL